MSQPNPIHIFGIRHHGPGSARSLRQALETLQPDIILVEGPPDAAGVLPLLIHEEMQPPVALLIYVPGEAGRAVYYPFAIFSPEWQAMHFGMSNQIPVRFMDLPQTHQLAMVPPAPPPSDEAVPPAEAPEGEAQPEPAPQPGADIASDPLGAIARAAGYSDGERWWEHMVEHRRDSADLFAAILETMTALRQSAPPTEDPIEILREAHMRQTIRAAQREGFQKIAVVCGAWHGPALAEMPPAKEDADLLKGLPKVKVESTWVPWTHGRLAFDSGYGAGIESPGWYHHLWSVNDQVVTRWMTRVARLLRAEDLDASSAHVIEAVRLAESLAAIRDRPLPGLPELNEATQAILCFGDDMPMQLIHEKLIVGELLGEVPDETPMVPLQQDLRRLQKRLRMPADAAPKQYDLDQRKPSDLERSYLLHRLNLLGIPWGKKQRGKGIKHKGTFWEHWVVQWKPEFAVSLIEASLWGPTVIEATVAYARDRADNAPDLPTLTTLLNESLLADLPEAIQHIMERVQAEAALTSDVTHLMGALPPLASVLRYGNVRQTDTSMVHHVVDGLVARICIGLPGACASLNDEAAAQMFEQMLEVHSAISLLQNEEHLKEWHSTLTHLADMQGLHGLLAGRCCRLLLDLGNFTTEDVVKRMSLALSAARSLVNPGPAQPSTAVEHAGAWVEGFLRGSGIILLHDNALWQVLDDWVNALNGATFIQLLPLLRRTFSTFSPPERRQMGERAKRGTLPGSKRAQFSADAFDSERAEQILPIVAQLLGL
ncbi:MAG: hypothetical protein H0T73_19915 [Ardenticatenales bacterium]|nr:hypothetical protein [Ardenticatenales bacterium]